MAVSSAGFVPASRTRRAERPESLSQLSQSSSRRNSQGRRNLGEGIHKEPSHTHSPLTFMDSLVQRVSTKRTGEELPGGGAQLNLLVNLEGQIGQLLTFSAGAQPRLQGHALHVLRHLQHLQHIDEFACRSKRRR